MKLQPGVGYTFNSSSSGFTIDTAEQFPDNASASTFPFQIISVGASGSNFRYRVVSGTLNNIVPEIDDVVSSTEVLLDRVTSGIADPPIGQLSINSTTNESWIYLRAGVSGSTGAFPDSDATTSNYPKVISSNTVLFDTDTYGYVLLGKFTMNSYSAPTSGVLNQYVGSSLWGDRLKTGTDTARYYYARI